jgi:uncharacterized membrane protein HdeD (DUF308 family)
VTTTQDFAVMREASRYWWVPLISGIFWLVVALVVLRFNEASVTTAGILAGATIIAAGINDLALANVAERNRWFYYVLAAILIPLGFVALFSPGNTFEALAALVGWYLLFKGVFDIVHAFMNRMAEYWWVWLVVGTIELLLAFWAAGYFGRKAVLVIIFVAAAALSRGVVQLTLAFQMRELKETG